MHWTVLPILLYLSFAQSQPQILDAFLYPAFGDRIYQYAPAYFEIHTNAPNCTFASFNIVLASNSSVHLGSAGGPCIPGTSVVNTSIDVLFLFGYIPPEESILVSFSGGAVNEYPVMIPWSSSNTFAIFGPPQFVNITVQQPVILGGQLTVTWETVGTADKVSVTYWDTNYEALQLAENITNNGEFQYDLHFPKPFSTGFVVVSWSYAPNYAYNISDNFTTVEISLYGFNDTDTTPSASSIPETGDNKHPEHNSSADGKIFAWIAIGVAGVAAIAATILVLLKRKAKEAQIIVVSEPSSQSSFL